MAIILLLSWWYSKGWLWVVQITERRMQTVAQVFAIKILLQTLFSPWKQIYSPSTFSGFFRDMLDNTVSRFIGAFVRGSILLWAGVLSIIILIIGVASAVAWPLLPLLIVALPIISISGWTP